MCLLGRILPAVHSLSQLSKVYSDTHLQARSCTHTRHMHTHHQCDVQTASAMCIIIIDQTVRMHTQYVYVHTNTLNVPVC